MAVKLGQASGCQARTFCHLDDLKKSVPLFSTPLLLTKLIQAWLIIMQHAAMQQSINVSNRTCESNFQGKKYKFTTDLEKKIDIRK